MSVLDGMILYLDEDPKTCAMYVCDQDLSQQMAVASSGLIRAAQSRGFATSVALSATGINHIAWWMTHSILHWNWAFDYYLCLNHELKYRVEILEDHVHFDAITRLIDDFQNHPDMWDLPDWKDPPIPGELLADSVVQQYRQLYQERLDTRPYSYTKRSRPVFLGTPHAIEMVTDGDTEETTKETEE